jgi:tetratricopeptide (TPR) repeat protein
MNQALHVDPEYIDAITEKSSILIRTGRYDSALFYIEKIKAIDPKNINFYDQKGLYYFYTNVPDSALKYSLKVDEMRPNNIWTKLALGQIYIYGKNEIIKGLSYYQQSIDLGGVSEPEINLNISSIYSNIDYYSKAEKYLKKALSITSECQLIPYYNSIILNEGNYNRALNFLDSISDVTACQQTCDLMRFYLYTIQRDFEKAEKLYNKVLKAGYKREDNFDFFVRKADETDLYIGYLYNETGRKKDAIAILNKFIQKDKNALSLNSYTWLNSMLNLQLAAAYALLDDNKNALLHLTEVEKAPPGEWSIRVKSFPGFDKIRNNPEFNSILKRIEDKKAAIRSEIMKMEQRKEINM